MAGGGGAAWTEGMVVVVGDGDAEVGQQHGEHRLGLDEHARLPDANGRNAGCRPAANRSG
jgi:hypothetical protein